MRTWKIANILAKAQRMPAGYLDDCKSLAEAWDEQVGTATFTPEALAEIRATWNKQPARQAKTKPCNGCRGL